MNKEYINQYEMDTRKGNFCRDKKIFFSILNTLLK